MGRTIRSVAASGAGAGIEATEPVVAAISTGVFTVSNPGSETTSV